MYAYRNKNTKDVAIYGEKHPELEALPNWESIDAGDVPESARVAFERAAAEERMIAEAQVHRYDHTAAANTGSLNQESARSGTLAGAAPPAPTSANYTEFGTGDQESVLDKTARGAAAVQIGPDPETHPATKEEVAALGAWQTENPPTDGVLARAKRDHKAGHTQIGDDPAIHAHARSTYGADSASATTTTPSGGDGTEPTGESSGGDDARTALTSPAEEDVNDGGESDNTSSSTAAGDDDTPRPPRSARKPELVSYAVNHGGMSEADANALTRDELVERFAR